MCDNMFDTRLTLKCSLVLKKTFKLAKLIFTMFS